ncbi:AI-2E family transporter [Weissella diestrammenae]|uniref:AI-2E family transporter n=1 Tax=Weissella diestrammenae TaxID=1162633 RepID=A0A7G9T6E3_9LACO|nr:AI-2E family transporter [Weissella diestrammenae]MCM0583285.1 AI-2E family transporter [Weissella diestrammenae]QNN75668.1 AI-2E family transporter [Weissella diestrammenae]
MLDKIVAWWLKDKTQLYLTLLFLVVVVYLIRGFMPMVLLMIIFASLGINGGRFIQKYLRIPYALAVIVFYISVILALVAIVSFIAPMFYQEGVALVKAMLHGIDKYPQVASQVDKYLANTQLDDKITNGLTTVLHTSLVTLQNVWAVLTEIVIALILSFVYAISLNSIQRFGKQFMHSDFPRFFKNIYYLADKFIYILGQIIQVQLVIDVINTVLSIIGFTLLGMPSPLVLGSLVIVLGLIPVAGVLISLVPLVIIAFSAGGIWLAVELVAFILIIHTFEAYFLHPKLMASRSELPIFVTFAALIIMERLLGAWGLILGVPIVSFLLDVLNVHRFSRSDIEVL